MKIFLRRRLDSVGTAAHVNAVEVKGQDLVFGKFAFQPEGHQQFLHLALDVFLRGQKQVFGQLLGDGAAALGIASLDQVGGHGAGEGDDVEPEMGIKTPVFGGNYRIDDVGRQFVGIDHFRINVAEGGNFLSVFGNDRSRGLPSAGNRLFNVGQGGKAIADVQRQRGADGKGGKEKQFPPAEAAGRFFAAGNFFPAAGFLFCRRFFGRLPFAALFLFFCVCCHLSSPVAILSPIITGKCHQ